MSPASEASGSPIDVIQLGHLAYHQAWHLMQRLAMARQRGEIGDTLLLVEHPPVLTLGFGGGREDLRVSETWLRQLGIEVVQTDRGGRITYHGPGQLVAYPILKLPDLDLHAYVYAIEQVIIETLADWGIQATRVERHPGVWIGRSKIAAIGVAVADGVTTHGLAINVNPIMEHFQMIVPCGLVDRGVTSLCAELGRPVAMAAVARSLVAAFAGVMRRPVGSRRTPGPWLVAPAAQENTGFVERLVNDLSLHTVCQEAACPNLGECWAHGTATFMLLGDVCTRHCRFCNVAVGRPRLVDPFEPARVAEAADRLGLRHVVLTAVARDDLPDGGAAQFAATIRAIRERLPGVTVEALVPDFAGSLRALAVVAAARPDVFNHNVETVARLSNRVRARAKYRRSLAVLTWAKQRGLITKSGLMVGLGETCAEVVDTLRDLAHAGCDIVTIGQYLQPTPQQLDVVEFVHPQVFAWYQDVAHTLGFKAVASGPLVRSSYHADEVWAASAPAQPWRERAVTYAVDLV